MCGQRDVRVGNAKLIGAKIKKRREELDISQEKLAELIGKRQRDIWAYENKNRDMLTSTLIRMAEALQVPVSSFFTDNDPELEEILLNEFRLLTSSQAKRGAVQLVRVYRTYREDE